MAMSLTFKIALVLIHTYLSLQWCLKATYYELAGSLINEVDISLDNNYILVGSNSKRASILSVTTSNVVWFTDYSNSVTTAKFGSTGKYMAIGFSGDDTVKVYNVPAFTPFASFRAQHGNTETIYELDFNSDDSKIATCASNGYVNQLSISGTLDWKGVVDSTKNVLACKYSSMNTVGLYCDVGDMVLLKTDGTINNKQTKFGIKDVDFRKTGERYLYGGHTDKKVYEYDTNSNSIGAFWNPNKDEIWAISHAPDNSYIATGMKSGHITIINTTNRNSPSTEDYFKDSSANIYTIRVSKDSNYIVAGFDDGIIRLYSRRCSNCALGSYRNLSSCRLCSLDIPGCQSCVNSSICLSCLSNYYLDSTKKCTICEASSTLIGCYLCKSSTVCTACTQSYYLSGSTCLRCDKSIANCEECLNNGTCIKCSYLTYLTSSGICSLCKNSIPNCVACYLKDNSTSPTLSTLYCSQCTRGFYASTSQCLPCSTGCHLCISSGACLACNIRYQLSGTTCILCSQYCQTCHQNGTCIDCMPGTFVTGTGTCSACTFPCITCTTSATTCSSCPSGYFLSGTTCNKCVGCPICNPFSGVCLICPPGQYLQTSSSTCKFCLNTTSKCELCSQTTCFSCERNYYLTGTGTCAKTATITDCLIYEKNSTTVCTHCVPGLYLDTGGACQACPQQCADCESTTNCTQCHVGYYRDATNTKCFQCTKPCISCSSSSSTDCLSCSDEYYLSGTSCLKCWDQIPYCNSCLNSTHCLDCYVGYQLATNSLSCTACVSPCATCSSLGCLSCEPGYFYLSNSCNRCSDSCTSCMSALICSTCVTGYGLDSSNVCVTCSTLFSNCQQCSNTACKICKPYFMLSSTGSCVECSSNVTNCLSCDNSGLCSMCKLGFYPASNKLSCINCTSTIANCETCVSGTACDKCQLGFFLNAPTQCQRCMDGCLTCQSLAVCDICETGFVKVSSSCIECSQNISGCFLCTSSGVCSDCLIGYYLASSTSCPLCSTAMEGCISCTSSTVCESCDFGYFINGTSKCQRCSTTACDICSQSTGICTSCQTGYFLSVSNQCTSCSSSFTGCSVCSSIACLQCESGTYLSAGVCNRCTVLNQNCIICNSSRCLQCKSSHYLDSSGSCQLCSLTGCETCSPDGLTCLSCENLYYKVGAVCRTCESMNFGCLTCSGLNTCLICKTGYYLETNGTCVLCENKFPGCDLCNFTRCSVCETNYFHDVASVNGNCLICSQFLPGCSLCLSQTSCLLCESGYYLQSLQCHSCTSISQCMVCQDSSTCLFCGAGYFFSNGACLSCSSAIPGCFSCVSNTVCTSCSGSFVMSVGTCVEVKGVSLTPVKYSNIRIASEYVNATHLKHTLLTSEGLQFKQIEQNWNQVTTLQLVLPPANKTTLTILKVEWQPNKLNSLVIYTNNPLGQISSNQAKSMPFIKVSRRLLLTLDELNMQISFSMKKAAIQEILPDLDTKDQDLGLDYKLDKPQFYKSIVKSEKYYYHLFGIAVIGLIVCAYLIKICFLIPMTSDPGEIIPHILLLKLPAMLIYPALGGYINFCYGFTYPDLPWFNDFFSLAVTNDSDKSPNSFLMFYRNLSIASTYMAPLLLFVGLMIPLKIILMCRNWKKDNVQKAINDQKSATLSDNGSMVLESSIDRVKIFSDFFYNVFLTGLTVASFLGIIGMTYNPTDTISGSAGLYILCVFIYASVWFDAIGSFSNEKASFNKIRVVIKATLMVSIFWSPITLFSAMVLIDMALMAYEYKLKLKKWVVPKLWLVSHSLLLLSYGALIFLSNMLIGIIIACLSVTTVLVLDILLMYFEHIEIEKIKDMRQHSQEYSENNLSIQGFIPDRKDILEDFRNEESNKSSFLDNGLYNRSLKVENKNKNKSVGEVISNSVNNSINFGKTSNQNTFTIKEIIS